jgi:hypothetical protein
VDDIGKENEENDDCHITHDGSQCFQTRQMHYWFFDSSQSELMPVDRSLPLQMLHSVEVLPAERKFAEPKSTCCYDIYGNLASAVSSLTPNRIASFQQLPALHKFWRRDLLQSDKPLKEHKGEKGEQGEHSSQKEEDLRYTVLTEKLMPYLSSFTDMFMEGLNEGNEREMAEAVLSHCISHVVRARLAPTTSFPFSLSRT